MSPQEWCEFFRKIEDDPTKIITGMTVRKIMEGREHLNNCDDCYMRQQRVLAKAPPQTFMDIQGMN